MPVYEYEPDDRECLICPGRVEVLQAASEKPCQYCPICGLGVRRVVSQASFSTRTVIEADKASDLGFTTYRKAEKGIYERIAGEGPEKLTKDLVDKAIYPDSMG